jgi:GT2 family glycosyltransferase
MILPHVAVIIVNWNRREDTLACLESLGRLDYPSLEIILVDNASTDGSAGAVRQAFPGVTVLEAPQNLGFVAGNNLGLAHARRNPSGAQVACAWLLNNDTVVAPDSLRLLVEAVESYPGAGAAGPTIYYYDRPAVIWSAGGAIDWKHGRTRSLGLETEDRGQAGDQPQPVDFVTGCALLAKMEVFERVGMLDPRFYAYYEETEWCVRAARAGYQILHVPRARIWHKISIDARDASSQVLYYMMRNRLLFLKLAGSGARAWLGAAWDYGYRLARWTLLPRWRHKADQRGIVIRAILDFGRGRFGKVDIAPAFDAAPQGDSSR